jgi:hypothetical protein
MYPELNQMDALSRRKFMQYAAKAFLGLGLSSVTRDPLWAAQAQQAATAKQVIYIYLAGGMSHIDTFDLKPNWKDQGPVDAIQTNVTGLRIAAYFPNLARHMDKLAIIRSMNSNQGAHEQGRYFLHTSYEPRGTIQHPGLGAWLNHLSGATNSTLPGNIRIGGSNNLPGGCGFLDAKYAPLHLGNPHEGLSHAHLHHGVSDREFSERMELVKLMDLSFQREYSTQSMQAYTDVYKEAAKLMFSEDLKAFDLNQESSKVQERYAVRQGHFGAACLLSRRLIESGVQFVQLTSRGWDTHHNNHNDLESLGYEIDAPIAALLDDLQLRGLLDETLVVIGTEFGRAPELDHNLGRSHHPQAFTCMMAGGGIRGGQVYGATDERGQNVTENLVSIPDFNATIAHALGLPIDKILYAPNGRSFQIADKGRPILDLF